MPIWKFRICLNPCFNGRYSQRTKEEFAEFNSEMVLILVLMEDTLREPNIRIWKIKQLVLILVLMEDTLRGGERIYILRS